MKISTKGRYGVTALYELALHYGEGAVALKTIAQNQGISEHYLEQLMAILRNAGFVTSIRGAQGGYMLAKSPDMYTVGDILRITEGSIAPVSCLEGGSSVCDRDDQCMTLYVWEGLEKVIAEYLDSITLQDILDRHRKDYTFDFII